MRLTIHSSIDINAIVSSLSSKLEDYLKSKCVITRIQENRLVIIPQHCDLPFPSLNKVMQIIEEASVDPLMILWTPTKFVIYTEQDYKKLINSRE